MTAACLVCTYGDESWSSMAGRGAIPSAVRAGFDTVVHVHRERGTLAEVRNRAVEMVNADWLCFLDADDELAPLYAGMMRYEFETERRGRGYRPRPLLLAPQMQEMHKLLAQPYFPNRHQPITVLNHCVIGTMLPRWLFLKAGGFRELPVYEDWDLWLRCISLGAEIRYVEDAVYRADMGLGRNRGLHPAAAKAIYDQIRREHLESQGIPVG